MLEGASEGATDFASEGDRDFASADARDSASDFASSVARDFASDFASKDSWRSGASEAGGAGLVSTPRDQPVAGVDAAVVCDLDRWHDHPDWHLHQLARQ